MKQDVAEGKAATQRFHGVMRGLLATMRSKRPDESSIAAHLLDIKDPDTGEIQHFMGAADDDLDTLQSHYRVGVLTCPPFQLTVD